MNVENKPGTAFEELLKSLKAVDDEAGKMAEPDDKAVKMAAAEGDDDEDDEDDENDGEKSEGMPFGKSLGTNAEGDDLVDATDLVKSLMERVDVADFTLAKAMGSLVSAMSKQTVMIKSLQNEITTLSSQGRGRKTVLSVLEKPGTADTLAKSNGAAAPVTPAELLVKCHSAFDAGRLTAGELNKVDVCLRNSWPVDVEVLRKVAAAS